LLPITTAASTVSLSGRLDRSTIALICAAIDYLPDVAAETITVDLRGMHCDQFSMPG
jgi:hypothetical protein